MKKSSYRISRGGGTQRLLNMWRSYQCEPCRNGDRSKCSVTRENAMAFIERPNGSIEYFCFLGCALMKVHEEAGTRAVNRVITGHFSDEGHYEMLRNDCADGIKRVKKGVGE